MLFRQSLRLSGAKHNSMNNNYNQLARPGIRHNTLTLKHRTDKFADKAAWKSTQTTESSVRSTTAQKHGNSLSVYGGLRYCDILRMLWRSTSWKSMAPEREQQRATKPTIQTEEAQTSNATDRRWLPKWPDPKP